MAENETPTGTPSGTPAETLAIEVDRLVRRFGSTTVLKDINLSVQWGEIFGLIGPSGSGKSTLLRALTGYLSPSEGAVRVFGEDPTTFGPADRRRLGIMPQKFVLYEDLSVKQNLNFVARLYDLRFGDLRRRVRETLEFVELWEHRRKAASNISGGMQRRLQLAATIVHQPQLLFVDEPTASLDPILRRRFWDEFTELRDRGHTIFVTTQYVEESELCDRVGFLSNGALAAVGTPDELRRQAFGGEIIEMALGGDPGSVSGSLTALKEVGQLTEVREDTRKTGDPVSRARLIVEDSEAAMPRIMNTLQGADVRSVDILEPSFDEVFFHLVRDE